ncbi:UNKNOWN [Stylonychia lemnae]|uniref:Uncharacterized protein n=1 Tax=Stylonychia lemnae TaxID=5949 RepID=A0A078A9P9_STYLE|nr:UNKNOWN [Stylonychia lemnae]|eukprot:CDW78904.1 UNKNOWN [Stylonychia lemnae]
MSQQYSPVKGIVEINEALQKYQDSVIVRNIDKESLQTVKRSHKTHRYEGQKVKQLPPLIGQRSDNAYLKVKTRDLNIKSTLDKYPQNQLRIESSVISSNNQNHPSGSVNYQQLTTQSNISPTNTGNYKQRHIKLEMDVKFKKTARVYLNCFDKIQKPGTNNSMIVKRKQNKNSHEELPPIQTQQSQIDIQEQFQLPQQQHPLSQQKTISQQNTSRFRSNKRKSAEDQGQSAFQMQEPCYQDNMKIYTRLDTIDTIDLRQTQSIDESRDASIDQMLDEISYSKRNLDNQRRSQRRYNESQPSQIVKTQVKLQMQDIQITPLQPALQPGQQTLGLADLKRLKQQELMQLIESITHNTYKRSYELSNDFNYTNKHARRYKNRNDPKQLQLKSAVVTKQKKEESRDRSPQVILHKRNQSQNIPQIVQKQHKFIQRNIASRKDTNTSLDQQVTLINKFSEEQSLETHTEINNPKTERATLSLSINTSIKRIQKPSIQPQTTVNNTHGVKTPIQTSTGISDEVSKQFKERMNFDKNVMQFEFEKAERMLKRKDKLIQRVKTKSIYDDNILKRPQVKFSLPEI